MTKSSRGIVRTKMEDCCCAKRPADLHALRGMFKEQAISFPKPRVSVYSPTISYYFCLEISGFLILKTLGKCISTIRKEIQVCILITGNFGSFCEEAQGRRAVLF